MGGGSVFVRPPLYLTAREIIVTRREHPEEAAQTG